MKILNQIIGILFIAAFVTVSYFALIRIDRYLNLKAIDDCAKEYYLEYTDSEKNTKIVRPLEEPFMQCIRQKGVTNWQQIGQ